MTAAVNDTNQAALFSRRAALGLFAATPALSTDAALTRVFGGAAMAGASVLGADAASACGDAAHDLSQLSVEHFEALVGETFTVGDAPMTLRDVRRGPPTPFRMQFAMTFDAAADAPMASDVRTVAHPAIGQHDLYVSEVRSGADRRAVEICFS
jgi:hypothetical protein